MYATSPTPPVCWHVLWSPPLHSIYDGSSNQRSIAIHWHGNHQNRRQPCMKRMSDNSPKRELAPDDPPHSIWTIRPQFLDNSPPSCQDKYCWSLTFRELVTPKGAVFVCVCLSLLKFTLFERGENRPLEVLSNSFGRTSSHCFQRWRVFSAWLLRPTAGVSWAFCLKPDGSACWLRQLPGVIPGQRCKGAAANVLSFGSPVHSPCARDELYPSRLLGKLANFNFITIIPWTLVVNAGVAMETLEWAVCSSGFTERKQIKGSSCTTKAMLTAGTNGHC